MSDILSKAKELGWIPNEDAPAMEYRLCIGRYRAVYRANIYELMHSRDGIKEYTKNIADMLIRKFYEEFEDLNI